MQEQKEIIKINHFLNMVLPLVAELVSAILRSAGAEVQKEGSGLDTAFSIKSGEKEAKFYLHNLLLEIATLDRDEEPLRFDERLRDFDFFLAKTANAIQSKLRILFHVLEEDDIKAAVKNISRDAKLYERVRIWQFDQGKHAKGHEP
jgi:hypothetical protein